MKLWSLIWLSSLVIVVSLSGCQSAPVDTNTEATPPQITVEAAWSRNAPEYDDSPGITYMVIHNQGGADKLMAAKTDAADIAELHIHELDSYGVMRMRPVPQGYIEIPANDSVHLEPGGLHVMLIDLTQSLVTGETFPMTLKFETFGEVVVDVLIKDPDAELEAMLNEE